MPFVVIWVIWNLVVVNVLTSSEYSVHLNKLPGVDFGWSLSFISKVSWDPPSVDDDSSSFNFDWITTSPEFFHGYFTSFVAIKWINYIKTFDSVFLLWDEDFFSEIKLS